MLVIGNDELAYIISKQLQINPSKLIPLLTCRFMVGGFYLQCFAIWWEPGNGNQGQSQNQIIFFLSCPTYWWLNPELCLFFIRIEQCNVITTQVIRGEKVSVSLSLSEALNTRDALSKALYSQLFKWLVHRVNRMINPTVQQNKSIALLDIFGFEVSSIPSSCNEGIRSLWWGMVINKQIAYIWLWNVSWKRSAVINSQEALGAWGE